MKRIIYFILIVVIMLSCTLREEKNNVIRNVVTPNGRVSTIQTEQSTKNLCTFIVHTSADTSYSIKAKIVSIDGEFVRYKIEEEDYYPTRVKTNSFIYHIVKEYKQIDSNYAEYKYHTLEIVLSNRKRFLIEATHYNIIGGRIDIIDKNLNITNNTFMLFNLDYVDYFKFIK